MPLLKSFKPLGSLFLCIAMLAASSCATPQGSSKTDTLDQDPLEPFNRGIYQFNYTVDGLIIKPVATVYRGVVPELGRQGVSNFLANLYMPVVFFNSVFQADPENSFASFWRFVINTTMGLGGFIDVASDAGLKYRHTDLGQTFGIYGAGPGPYIVLPIIGPSNGRDAIGRLGDALMNPFNYIDEGVSISIWSATAIDYRANNMKLIDSIYESSLDPYATFRSGYTQKRASDIKRAKADRDKALDKALAR